MSFDYSVGDAVLLTQLAWKIVQISRNACGEHHELTREVLGLHIVLQKLEHEYSKADSPLNRSSDTYNERLQVTARGCEIVLRALDTFLEKYNEWNNEDRSSRKLWKKIRFGNGQVADMQNLRSTLATYTSAMSLLLNVVSLESVGRIERQLSDAGRDLQEIKVAVHSIAAHMTLEGNDQGSVLTSYTNDDKAVWKEFRRELLKKGFASSNLKRNKSLIVAYIKELGDRGLFDDDYSGDLKSFEGLEARNAYSAPESLLARNRRKSSSADQPLPTAESTSAALHRDHRVTGSGQRLSLNSYNISNADTVSGNVANAGLTMESSADDETEHYLAETFGTTSVSVAPNVDSKELEGTNSPLKRKPLQSYADSVVDNWTEEFDDSNESDSDETASSAFSMLSESSKSSTSSHATMDDTLVAALDEVVALFMGDEDLHCLFAEAFTKQGREEVSRKGARLLKWLGRRLVVAAKTTVEKEAGKVFLVRRHNCAIIDKIARRVITKTSMEERKEEARRKVELYLQKRMENDGEGDDSSDSGDDDKANQETVQLNVDAVKLFLESSDAFARFKEEFEDFMNPFRSEAMWTKTLWNGRERVRFEHSNSVPRLTTMDKLKLAAEEKLGMPILWWPLRQPRKHLSSSKVRIIWICECGDETYADVSCAKARRYRQMCDTSPVNVTAGQPPILPTHNTSVTDSTGIRGFRASTFASIWEVTSKLQQLRKRKEPASQGSERNATIVSNATPTLKHIHWCVDSAPRRTFLHHICIERKRGKEFINELCKSYKKLRGWRWYLSMTTCTEIKLVKLSRVYRGDQAVVCTRKGDVLPDLGGQSEYTYNIEQGLEKEIHILRTERALVDHYHGYKNCHATDHLSRLVIGIPHRVTGTELVSKGYGIWARQGWTLARLATFALITQGWAVIFAAFWLWHHPGDLQNAFSPGYYSLGFVTIFVAVPDVFLT